MMRENVEVSNTIEKGKKEFIRAIVIQMNKTSEMTVTNQINPFRV